MVTVDEALKLASDGYLVFPLNDRIPFAGTHGCNDATTTPEKIREFWDKYPNANVGIACVGDVVVDIDPEGIHWADQQDWGDAAAATTPRGGRHYYYRVPAGREWRNTAGKLAVGVDTRASGGYVVAPPSVVEARGDKPAGAYEWVNGGLPPIGKLADPPAWLTRALDGVGKKSTREAIEDGQPILKDVRNNTLASLGGYMRNGGFSESEILAAITETNRTRCVPQLDQAEVEKIAWSISRYKPDQITTALAEDRFAQDRAAAIAADKTKTDAFPLPSCIYDMLPDLGKQFMSYYTKIAKYNHRELAYGALLTASGTILGHKIQLHRGTRTNMYVIGLAPTARGKNAGREVAMTWLTQGLTSQTSMCGSMDVRSGQGLYTELRREKGGHNPVMLPLDEFGQILSSMSGRSASSWMASASKIFLSLYTSSKQAEVLTGATAEKGASKIAHPCMSVYGTSTPSVWGHFNIDLIDSGDVGRLLIFEHDRNAAVNMPTATVFPYDLINWRDGWLGVSWDGEQFGPRGNIEGQLDDYAEPACTVIYADGVMDRLYQMDLDQHALTEGQENNRFLGIHGRRSEVAEKIAAIMAGLAARPGTVPVITHEWLDVGELTSGHNGERIYARLANRADDIGSYSKHAQAIIDKLAGAEDRQMGRTQLRRAVSAGRWGRDVFNSILAELDQDGVVESVFGGEVIYIRLV